MKTTLKVALGALVFTYLFFFEYLSPFRWVHVSYDLDGFHYPLMDYGFVALKEGRFPQWDITFSGISYAGNPQAALFYPGTWLLWAANWHRQHLSYTSLETFVIAHIWLAFVWTYLWLRKERQLGEMASIFGALIAAFSGFACSQMQHLGLIIAYAWFPLALWGIDQAATERRWQPLAKTAVASAFAFLGGYTPSWVVLAMFATVYAFVRNWRVGLGTLGALTASLGLTMVQLLPTWYLLGTKIPDFRYGSGLGPAFLISYLVPNFYDHGMEVPAGTNWPNEYVYLGAPALFGLAALLIRGRLEGTAPLWAALAFSLALFLDPFGLVAPRIEQFALLRQVCRSFYFAAGTTLAVAALAAHGLDGFVKWRGSPDPRSPDVDVRRYLLLLFILVSVTWGVTELCRWRYGHFSPRWSYEPFVTLALFGAGMWALPSRPLVIGALLLWTAAADYKAFGTSKRFNASSVAYKPIFTATGFAEMDDDAFREMKRHPEFRVLADVYLNPLQLRHFGLATPQGFDPFLPAEYERMLRANHAEFRSNWEFGVDPQNTALLNRLAVRYWITTDASPLYARLLAIPRFRELGREKRYFRVFEDSAALPPWGSAEAKVLEWTPETRLLETSSTTLAENLLPGWQITRNGGVIEYRYTAKGSWAGAAASLTSWSILGFLLTKKKRRSGSPTPASQDSVS